MAKAESTAAGPSLSHHGSMTDRLVRTISTGEDDLDYGGQDDDDGSELSDAPLLLEEDEEETPRKKKKKVRSDAVDIEEYERLLDAEAVAVEGEGGFMEGTSLFQSSSRKK